MSNTDFILEGYSKVEIDEVSVDLDEKYGDNSCRKSMSNIIWGFIFTIMTFNFLGLQYILPTLGVGLLYIGFRDLRKENKALNAAWIFSIINMGLHVLNLIYINIPMSVNFKINSVIIFIVSVFQVSFLLVFRKGLKNIFQKADTNPTRDPLLWLVIWSVIVKICAITELGSIWFIFIPLLFFYFYSFRSLYRLSADLVGSNYRPSKVILRISSKKFVWGYIIVCAFIVAICCVVSNNIRIDSREFITADHSEKRDKLIDLGFPEDILNDISDDEVDVLQDAIFVESSKELLMFDYKEENIKNDLGGYTTKKKPGKSNLEATIIYIELKDNRMYALEYFEWKDGSAYWNDGFAISGSEKLDLINGRLLYEKNGISYFASIPRLKSGMVTESNLIGYEDQADKITGAVNYPFDSDRERGYVFYRVDIRKDVWLGCNILNYTHYSNPFRIPYSETEQNNLMFSDSLRQHYTNFETKAYREANE